MRFTSSFSISYPFYYLKKVQDNIPRQLARRKSHRFSFSMTTKASTVDLKKVFDLYGTKPDPGVHDGFINAMQFSNIWRLITEEKGNLFKEMQMFKRYVVCLATSLLLRGSVVYVISTLTYTLTLS